MRITVSKNAMCGSVEIPANEYWVSLNSEAGEITLSASGKDIRLRGTRRRNAGKQKTTSVQFYSGGGKSWSLIVSTPKGGEWVVFLDYLD